MDKREQLLEIMEDAAKGETKATLRARIASLEAQLAERVKVKPLDWVKHPAAEAWRADIMLGTYQIWMGSHATAWQFDGLLGDRINEPADNEEAAKAAAQADYEHRVLAALEATPPAPKVAEEKRP